MGTLTNREYQIAEMIAWGAAQKEVAAALNIATKTVANTIVTVKRKIGVGKASEISAWYFCTRFNISFSLSPLSRKIAAIVLLCITMLTIVEPSGSTMVRPTRAKTAKLKDQ